MDAIEAFCMLVDMAEGHEKRRNMDAAAACAIGADFIQQMSGCWPAEERPSEVAPTYYERLRALEKRLALE